MGQPWPHTSVGSSAEILREQHTPRKARRGYERKSSSLQSDSGRAKSLRTTLEDPLKGFRVIVIPAVNQLLRFNHYAAVHGSGWPHQSCCFRDKSNFSYHIIGRCLGWL